MPARCFSTLLFAPKPPHKHSKAQLGRCKRCWRQVRDKRTCDSRVGRFFAALVPSKSSEKCSDADAQISGTIRAVFRPP